MLRKVEKTRVKDFDSFWDEACKEVNSTDIKIVMSEQKNIDKRSVERFTFTGIDGTPIHATYLGVENPKGCVIKTHGYGGNSGEIHEHLVWGTCDYDCIIFDARLQGNVTGSKTAIEEMYKSSVMTMNISEAKNYYLKLLYTDMLRVIRYAKERFDYPIILEGTSQAGGVALAAAALSDDVELVMANVPSFSNFPNRIIKGTGSCKILQEYIKLYPRRKEIVEKTTSYFDLYHLVSRIKCPVVASVGGLDETCPAEDFLKAYEKIESKKILKIYPLSGHEGGGKKHSKYELEFLQSERWKT